MNNDRRKFLKLTGSVALGTILIPAACNFKSENKTANTEDGIKDFGLQLWSVRDDMAKDPKAILKQIASYGYKQIESFEGAMGMYWGMSNTDFKKYMDELNIKIVSSHCDINKDFEKKAAEAAAIGIKYLICPWFGPQKTIDDFKKEAEKFNTCGAICKKEGISFAYHNHDYGFKKLEGQLPQQVMMDNTDPALVDFEMDIYWVATANEDPEQWLKKYKNRFRLCHVKDRSKTLVEDNGKNSTDLGKGSIDFTKILKTAKENGMQYFIVEQEAYPNGTPMQAVQVDAEYMKGLKI
jgi:sugar phosphate isomerase/epimerase